MKTTRKAGETVIIWGVPVRVIRASGGKVEFEFPDGSKLRKVGQETVAIDLPEGWKSDVDTIGDGQTT